MTNWTHEEDQTLIKAAQDFPDSSIDDLVEMLLSLGFERTRRELELRLAQLTSTRATKEKLPAEMLPASCIQEPLPLLRPGVFLTVRELNAIIERLNILSAWTSARFSLLEDLVGANEAPLSNIDDSELELRPTVIYLGDTARYPYTVFQGGVDITNRCSVTSTRNEVISIESGTFVPHRAEEAFVNLNSPLGQRSIGIEILPVPDIKSVKMTWFSHDLDSASMSVGSTHQRGVRRYQIRGSKESHEAQAFRRAFSASRQTIPLNWLSKKVNKNSRWQCVVLLVACDKSKDLPFEVIEPQPLLSQSLVIIERGQSTLERVLLVWEVEADQMIVQGPPVLAAGRLQ